MPDSLLPKRPGRPRSEKTSAGEKRGVRTLERGLALLEALAQTPGSGLSEVARRVGLDPSTTYRLLETLRAKGFADWDAASGLWRVGLAAYRVGGAFVERGGLTRLARPAMEQLAQSLQESVNLAVLEGTQVVYVEQIEGPQMLRMFTHLGAKAPLHCSGVGKVLLAWRPQKEIKILLGRAPFMTFTKQTITQMHQLEAELEHVRAQGFAIDDEEREIGVRCVAAPIRDRSGEVVAAISLSAPASRLGNEAVMHVAQKVAQAGQAISARLGAKMTKDEA